MKIRWRRSTVLLVALYVFTAIFYGMVTLCQPFADFYIKNIYRPISGVVLQISGLFPFSLGEMLIVICVVALVLGLLFAFGWTLRCKGRRFLAWKYYGKAVLWMGAVLLFLCTMNWFSMYRATKFADRYLEMGTQDAIVWLEMFEDCTRELSLLEGEIIRDENGYMVLTSDLFQTPQKTMQKLGKYFTELSGAYPQVKPLVFSYFMSQSGTVGIFLPFFIEANYNVDVVDSKLPYIVCHEMSHVKGVIQEDEANFFGILACLNAEEADFRYSGYLALLEWLYENEPSLSEAQKVRYQAAEARLHEAVFHELYQYYPEHYWEEHEDVTIIPTEIVQEVQTVVYDTTLQVNGVEDGIESYDRVMSCLMNYYQQHGSFALE